MRTGVVYSITKLSAIRSGLDLMEVEIDDIAYRLFGDYTMYQKLIDSTVIYDTRPDIINGVEYEVLTDIAERSLVRTKEYEESPSLIPDGSEVHEVCNFALDSIGPGDSAPNVIVYLSTYEKRTSEKAKWVEMRVVDIKSQAHMIRVFSEYGKTDQEMLNTLDKFVGQYIRCNVMCTKFGLESKVDKVEYVGQPVTDSREVVAAIDIINRAVEGDEKLKEFMESNLFIERLRKHIDFEPGWHLVRIAAEICMYTCLKNITSAYSTSLLIRASIASRGYLLREDPYEFSKSVANTSKVLSSKALCRDKDLVAILDVAGRTTNPTKRAFIKVSAFVNEIIEERRGLFDEKGVIAGIDTVSRDFGGLL